MPIWDSDKQPWVRRHSKEARCYFCGASSLLVSFSDDQGDSERVEVYCDNSDCEAREVTILVMRDDGTAGERPDVRMLDELDMHPEMRERLKSPDLLAKCFSSAELRRLTLSAREIRKARRGRP